MLNLVLNKKKKNPQILYKFDPAILDQTQVVINRAKPSQSLSTLYPQLRAGNTMSISP